MELASPADPFKVFGGAHLAAIMTIAILAVALPLITTRFRSTHLVNCIVAAIVVVLIATEVAPLVHALIEQKGGMDVRYFLPLHFCDMAVFTTAYTLIARKQTVFEISYFWGMSGSVQAIITPDLASGFPSYAFARFFFGHGAVIIGVLFAVLGFGLKPRFKGVGLTAGLSLVLAGVVGGINLLLNTNYMYLCAPPGDTASPFFFLPWPWYIPFLSFAGLFYFILLWLPFGLWGRSQKGTSRD